MPLLLNMILLNAVMASLLALLAAGATYWIRRPALSHGLWFLVLLKLLTPPIIPFEISWPSTHLREAEAPAEPPHSSSAGASPSQETASGRDDDRTAPSSEAGPVTTILIYPVDGESLNADTTAASAEPTAITLNNFWMKVSEHAVAIWPRFLAPLWLTGSLLWLGWTGWHVYRFQRLLRHAQIGPEDLQNEVRNWAARLGVRKCPTLWLLPGCVSPMVWSVGRAPRLLFPAKLLDRLDDEQRSALLIHELAHLRRGDHWVRWIEMAVMAIYWWHPVVWWARRELHEAEEQCCDAWVVWTLTAAGKPRCVSTRVNDTPDFSAHRRAYALALLHTVDFFSHARPTLPAPASGVGQVPHLRRRLTMIMNGNTPKSLSSAGRLAVLGLGLLLPLMPVQAQSAPQGPMEERDLQIQKLKNMLQALEQQKHAEDALKAAQERKELDLGEHRQAVEEKVMRAELAHQQAQAQQQQEKAIQFLQLAQGQDPERRIEVRAVVVDDKASPNVQKMMRAIEEITRAIEAKRQELRILEEKLQHARVDLEKIRVDGAVRRETQRRIELKGPEGGGDREAIILRIDPSASPEQVKKQVDEIQARVKQPIRVEIRTAPEAARGREAAPAPEARIRAREAREPREPRDGRGDNLEQKLERIMKEVEELRKELRDSKAERRGQ